MSLCAIGGEVKPLRASPFSPLRVSKAVKNAHCSGEIRNTTR